MALHTLARACRRSARQACCIGAALHWAAGLLSMATYVLTCLPLQLNPWVDNRDKCEKEEALWIVSSVGGSACV